MALQATVTDPDDTGTGVTDPDDTRTTVTGPGGTGITLTDPDDTCDSCDRAGVRLDRSRTSPVAVQTVQTGRLRYSGRLHPPPVTQERSIPDKSTT